MQHLRLMFTWMVAAFTILAGGAVAQDAMDLTYPSDALAQLENTQTPAVSQSAGKISANWKFIAASFKEVGDPSNDFKQVMQHNVSLLQKAAAKPDDPFSVTLVRDVEEDLQIKAEYISTAGAVGMMTVAAFSEVDIEVRTKRSDGQEVHGYFVGFSPRHLAGSDPMHKFNNPTSPSSGTLPPGRYEMTANLNGQIVRRQEVSVGIQGQQGQPITCLVP
ncbi:hypothetical protein [Mesorhizobium sp.]|uniref:hypothetical protein n=1 Tax=Mesorhizobium sp. TaxID=1871066 RepID=UPI000FE9A833|nr:hypothetical protein [Mesorhizobium sp.]RWB34598.1 MAG: hypothetical protein EOQ41_09085 [Mesorhizobium sp.]RWD43964.1 MAG: hypothetical protein EOS35_19000 [Mesorhizobium sp.]TIT16243.1 MAG: hypothetical protein E5W85_04030 [Mesorhizobium sp.]